MKNLIIHAGHGKTGSSYLQSVFALNRKLLKQEGFHYPKHDSDKSSMRGFISSGNGAQILLDNFHDMEHEKLFFSNELLFHGLLNNTKLLKSISERYNLEVVLYLRDVIEHRVSAWTQNVKRGGLTQDLNTFLLVTKSVMPNVVRWIQISKKMGFVLTLRNYSKQKNSLIEDFFGNVLKIQRPLKKVILPKQKIVNRSLSFSEIEIQRVFNAAFGKSSSRYISDFLCNKYPNDVSYKPLLSEHAYEKIYCENLEHLNYINSFLDENMAIEIGSREKWIDADKKQADSLDEEVCLALGENIRKFGYEMKLSKKIKSMITN